MTEQTTEPLQHQRLQSSHRQAMELVNLMQEGSIWPHATYQRGLVWTERDQRNLVRSWLLGLPIPAIVLNNRMTPRWQEINGYDPRYALIDGKQRLTAAARWFGGVVTIPASWLPADHIEQTLETDDGPYVAYKDLTPRAQRYMRMEFLLPVVEATVATEAEEATIYGLLNTAGVPQTADDLARAAAIAQEAK